MQSKVKVNFLKRNCFSSLYFVLSTVFFVINTEAYPMTCINYFVYFCYTCIFSFAQNVKLSTLFR